MTISLTGCTVLVLAQGTPSLQIVANALEGMGARTLRARSYEEALPRAVLEPVDAIVCEVGTGNARDGVELVRTLRELAELGSHLPRMRALAVGELPRAPMHVMHARFDDRVERSAAPGTIVSRLATLVANVRRKRSDRPSV